MQSFTQLLSLYCVLLMQCDLKKTLVNVQVVPVKVSLGTIFDPDTKRLIRKCFTCTLPMFYRFCFMKKNLLRSKSLLSSGDTFMHAGRNLERQLTTLPEIDSKFFMDEYVYLELIALMTLMEATKVYEDYGGKLKDDKEATEISQTFEILKQGTSSIQGRSCASFLFWSLPAVNSRVETADYYSLAEHLQGDSNNVLPDNTAASALGITCTLMNRSIKFFELKIYSDRKACYEAAEVHYTLADRLLCVPEMLLEQLLLFPVKAGLAYFLTLPVFFTIQLLLTYTTFENHFLTRLDVSPVERKISLTNNRLDKYIYQGRKRASIEEVNGYREKDNCNVTGE
ncbi:uncharacterized protein DEA37_0007626 [Paragonimus westermani]|uniref:Uncharacterized protein n=1 Tax=Paragonimus westermani TaxID=34504 RepID=A0A5J4N7G9_9TREM|nr:uncharacterized protein DEA37_0007626 [Paragonimus westermani]